MTLAELIAAFRAALDAEEAAVHATHGKMDDTPGATWWTPEEVKTRLCDDQIHMSDAAHIAHYSPARVLADIAAKRMFADEYERYLAERRRAMNGWDTGEVSPVLIALAEAYGIRA